MKELDFMYGGKTTEQELDEIEKEEEQAMIDPYLKKQKRFVQPQKFRTIKVGKRDMLRNGQMLQVAVCDAFNEEVFHPTDKIILLKHQDKYFALGSFCGFCYTNLATGALLGEKLMCPCCGSAYDITTGVVNDGPAMRNLSNFSVKTRNDQIELTVPEHIPAFSKKKFLKR